MTEDVPNEEKLEPKRGQIGYLKGKGFGEEGGADPREASKKGAEVKRERASVRYMVGALARHEFDFSENAEPIPKQIKRVFGSKMTGAQVLAATRFAQAMKNAKAMQSIVEDIDGKLIEKKVEAKVGYAELVAGSLERQRIEDEEGDILVTGEDTQDS